MDAGSQPESLLRAGGGWLRGATGLETASHLSVLFLTPLMRLCSQTVPTADVLRAGTQAPESADGLWQLVSSQKSASKIKGSRISRSACPCQQARFAGARRSPVSCLTMAFPSRNLFSADLCPPCQSLSTTNTCSTAQAPGCSKAWEQYCQAKVVRMWLLAR